MTRVRRPPGERGSMAVEFVLLVPVLILLFGLVVGGARVWLARGAVAQAAAAAARGASQARDSGDAIALGRTLARAQANTDGLHCQHTSLSVDAAILDRPAGTSGRVTARFGCAVPLGDVLVPGWPGSIEITADASAVVDRYRGRA